MTIEQGFGSVDRQLGGISAKLEGIMTMMRVRSEQADKQSEALQVEIRTLKHDQRGVEQKVEIVSWKQEQLESRVKVVAENLAEIKEPVQKLMLLRTRVGGMVIVITAIGGGIWLLFEAVGRWALDHWFGGRGA